MKSSGSKCPNSYSLEGMQIPLLHTVHLLGFIYYLREVKQGEIQCLEIRIPSLSFLEITILLCPQLCD